MTNREIMEAINGIMSHPWFWPAVAAVVVFYIVRKLRSSSASSDTEFGKAVARGDLDRVEKLIEAGVDVNAFRHGPALVRAAEKGDAMVVRELLMAGAKVDVRDRKGRTPLAAAKQKGRDEVVRILERAGAMK